MIRLPFLFALLFLLGCNSQASSLQKFVGFTMGTNYTIKCVTSQDQRKEIGKAVKELLKDFDQEMSNWNDSSWVTQFNASPAGQPMTIPKHSQTILKECLELHQKSNGAFDISISPILETWGFGSQKKTRKIPDDEQIAKILQQVGSKHLLIDSSKQSIQKKIDSIEINCSALAKGYAVDLIAEMLEEKFKIKHYLIEIGGEIRVNGHPPNKKAWTLAIQSPSQNRESNTFMKIIQTTQGAVATSGDYENFFEVEGKRYPHIFDPRTGKPVKHQLSSVTIYGPKCSITDGLATACLVLGPEKGKELLKKYPGYHGYFVERIKEGHYKESESEKFKDVLKTVER